MKFKLIYSIFLICSTLYVLQDFGLLLTLRQWSAVLLFIACVNAHNSLWIDSYFKIYLIFIFCFGISSLLDGYPQDFFSRLIGDYFVAYVAYWGTFIMCRDYKDTSLCIKIYTILGVFAAIVTLLQLLHIEFIDPYLMKLKLVQDQMQIDRMGTDIDLVGRAISGVFTSPVDNGHKLIAFLFLSFGFSRNKMVNFCIALIILVGLFAVQVRTPFYAAILLIGFWFIREAAISNNRMKYVGVPILIIGGIYLGIILYSMLSTGNFRYGLGMDLTGRDEIWTNCIGYIVEHPLLGGLYDYLSIYGRMPHNIVLNSLVYSGILGSVCIFFILVRQIMKVIKMLLSKQNNLIVLYCLSFIGIVLDSITHNIQVVNGDVLFWIFWGYIQFGFSANIANNTMTANK